MPLVKLIVRRSAIAVVVIWVVTTLTFFATQGLPGDTARAILGQNAAPTEVKALQQQLGLDAPVWQQYSDWLGGLLHGDLGNSFANRTSVSEFLGERLWNSLALMIGAAIIAIPLALGAGILAASHPGGIVDRFVTGVGLVLAALPEFVVGVLLVVLLATGLLHLFPAVSLLDPDESIFDQINLLVLPTLTLALAATPHTTVMIRATMMEALESEYANYATLKGMSRARVIFRHTLPNAIGPTVQVIALALAYLAGGVIAVEVVFGFPGIGAALVDAVRYRDLPVVQAIVVFIATAYVILTLAADVVGIVISPRRRTSLT